MPTPRPRRIADVPDRNVRSVDRAASLLVALGKWDGEAGVTDIARRLALHKSTVSRLLATLQLRGLVEQDGESGKYRLGWAVVRLGDRAEKGMDLRTIAMPELHGLAHSLGELATLGVLEGDAVATIAAVDPSGRVHDPDSPRRPLHATASGKVLLTHRPEREVIRLSKLGLIPCTTRTIVSVDVLLEEIARVRARGIGTSFGEHAVGVNAVAVPVLDSRGSPVAALEVRGAGSRMTASRLPEVILRAQAAAATIARRIGWVA